MRGFSLSIILLLLFNLAFAQVHEISLTKKQSPKNAISKSSNGIRFSFNHDKLLSKTKSENDGNSYTELWIKGSYPIGEIGTPKLPAYKKLIIIPRGSTPVLKVVSYSEQQINLKEKGVILPISPNQPSVRKDQDSSRVKFLIKKEVYSKASFSNTPIATIEVLGNLRSATIARLTVSPVDYNPGDGLLKVYNDIDIDVSFNESNSVESNQEFSEKTYSPYFDLIYNSLEGATKSSYTDHPDLTKYPVKMLIISNRIFEQKLQPFIAWKTLKGFNVKTVYTDIIGTTAAQIKSYIQQEYNSATPENPAPTFLLIVGDIPQVPASKTGTYTSRATDLYYASVDGDMFPDMYYGRLSATNPTELENIINKILYYEKYLFEDPSYLNKITLIAGVDAEWNSRVGQPTLKYGTANYFNPSHGFSTVNEYGVTSDPNNPSASSSYSGCYGSDKISVGLINYTAHGSETSWVSPSLGNSSISGFTNTNKYPLAIGNCCLSGDFGYSECLGEAWIRAQSKGAVTYIGSSPNSYWLEDFYWAVGAFPLVGNNNGYVPTFQETTTGAYDAPFVSNYVTIGALVFTGNLAVTEVNVQGFPHEVSPNYYWEAYNILGDPSIIPFFTEAETNQVGHNSILTIGETSILISALANSYIAISKDNQLIGTSFVNQTGELSVPINPITTPGDIIIVVTRPQTVPYIDTIPAITPTGPFLALDSFTIDDHLSNNNNKADYNELFRANLLIKNIGVENATNVKIKLNGLDDNIYINSNDSISISNISHINGINTLNVNGAFTFQVKENIPDQYIATFTLKFYSDQGNWTSKLRILLNSPILTLGDIFIDDSLLGGNSDSLLSPGETCKALVRVNNTGHAYAKDITFQVNIPDSLKNILSISNIQTDPFSLEANSFSTLPIRISVNPNLYHETIIPIKYQASVAKPSGLSQTFEKSITLIIRDSIKISNDTLNTCFTYFYDSGGRKGNYQNSENFITTFVAHNENNWLKLSFLEFSTEKDIDYLYVYNGPNTSSPQVIGSPFSGSALPNEIISSSRYLTVQFISNGYNLDKGWSATIECVDPQTPTCASVPIPSDGALFVQSGTLKWAPQKDATYYDVFLGSSPTNISLVGRVIIPEFNFEFEKSQTYYWQVIPGNIHSINSSSCNTWHFTTDTISSFVMSTNTLTVDTALFYDSGGSSGNYKNNENYILTLKPKYTGNNIQTQFLDFLVEGDNWDKIAIYNGLTTSSPLMGVYYGSNSPGTIQANNTDGALTFKYTSDISYTFRGWKAIVKSVGPVIFKTINLNVQNNTTPIANASVNIGGEIKSTDINGNVSFSVVVGDITLTANALGYKPLTKSVTESETNSLITIDLEKLSTVDIHVFDKKSLSPIYGVKIKTAVDSTFTNSSGLARFDLTPGSYTLFFDLKGYSPYSQQLIVGNSNVNLDIPLTAIKNLVSITVTDIQGLYIEGAVVNINDTTLTTNEVGLATGSFPLGNYPISISKSLFLPLNTWVSVNGDITKEVYLDALSSLHNIEFTLIGDGPKFKGVLENNDIDIYYKNIQYSHLCTNTQGKGIIQLPNGNFLFSANREGYFSIFKIPFWVDGLNNDITETLFQKTFSVQFNVKSQTDAIQDAIVTLNGYSPIETNSNGEASFMNIGYEKNLSYTIQKNGFVNASGFVDAINPLIININLNLNITGTQNITSNHFKIFPNPVSDLLTIESEHPISRVTIVNSLGSVVFNNVYPLINNVSISTEKLTPSIYFFIIYDKNSVPEKEMIIKK